MDTTNIPGYLIIAVIALSILCPLVIWFANLVTRHKLSRINSFGEFEDTIRIGIVRRYVKSGATHSSQERMNEILKKLESKDRYFKRLLGFPRKVITWVLCGTVFALLSADVLDHYLRIHLGDVSCERFPATKGLLLIGLCMWMSLLIVISLAISRIKMIAEKLREFGIKEHLG
jgi:hypothetical protein